MGLNGSLFLESSSLGQNGEILDAPVSFSVVLVFAIVLRRGFIVMSILSLRTVLGGGGRYKPENYFS